MLYAELATVHLTFPTGHLCSYTDILVKWSLSLFSIFAKSYFTCHKAYASNLVNSKSK